MPTTVEVDIKAERAKSVAQWMMSWARRTQLHLVFESITFSGNLLPLIRKCVPAGPTSMLCAC